MSIGSFILEKRSFYILLRRAFIELKRTKPSVLYEPTLFLFFPIENFLVPRAIVRFFFNSYLSKKKKKMLNQL